MNLILTSECNKKCSFCFAKEFTSQPEKEIFNFEFLQKIINEMIMIDNGSVKFDQIKLLGGEPTRYPDFIKLMNWLTEIVKERISSNTPMSTVNLISNFLYEDENILKSIKNHIDTGAPFGLLLNVSEMTERQNEIVCSNLLSLMSSNFDNTNLSFGFTINKKLSFSYYENILNNLNNKIVSVHRNIKTKDKYIPIHIRLSLTNPEHNTLRFSDFLKDKSIYSKIILDFISWGRQNNMKVRFDCGIYKCLFDEKELSEVLDWSDSFTSGCAGSALDLFPTGDMINCYPTSQIKTSYFKYNNIIPLCNEVELRHRLLRAEREYPEECKCCKYFMKGCNGPCSGYL